MRQQISVRGKEVVVETLRGELARAELVKALSVTKQYNYFFLDYGNDSISVFPTQQAAHAAFIKRDREMIGSKN